MVFLIILPVCVLSGLLYFAISYFMRENLAKKEYYKKYVDDEGMINRRGFIANIVASIALFIFGYLMYSMPNGRIVSIFIVVIGIYVMVVTFVGYFLKRRITTAIR